MMHLIADKENGYGTDQSENSMLCEDATAKRMGILEKKIAVDKTN